MEGLSATMPRTKYHALDSQQLTSAPRSTSSVICAPERRDSLFSDSCCDRGPASPHRFTSERNPLELPNSYFPKTASRRALEQLSFGSLQLVTDRNTTDEVSLPEKPAETRIFVESDFPPLQRSPPTPSNIVESVPERRSVTSPQLSQQRRPYRTSSVPNCDHQIRSRKPTSRSIRYRDGEIDVQNISKANLASDDTQKSNLVRPTAESSRKDSVFIPVEVEKRRVRNDMASAFPQMSGDARRHYPSGAARYENRPPVNRATPCKNGPLCRKFQEGWILFPP